MQIKRIIVALSLILASLNASAICHKANALTGHWTFKLGGTAFLTSMNYDGEWLESTNNMERMELTGVLQFNKASALVKGTGWDVLDVMRVSTGLVSLDSGGYQGLVVDKRLTEGDTRFNKWKKNKNSCLTTNIKVAFRSKDTINDQVYSKTYCTLVQALAKNKHTAILEGFCVKEAVYDPYEGIWGRILVPVTGVMQQRRNARM